MTSKSKEPTWRKKIRQAKNLLVEIEMTADAPPDVDRISIIKQDLIQYLKDHPHKF